MLTYISATLVTDESVYPLKLTFPQELQKSNMDFTDEVVAWCNQNEVKVELIFSTANDQFYAVFENTKDMMLFKLRWI